jgi:microcystin-dependent protein
MSDQFLGEIRMVGFNFAPLGWALCNGQLLSISQYSALFSLLGTQFGGNGTSNFQLPNLQSCVPVDQGQGPGLSSYFMGEMMGQENVSLLLQEMPSHSHTFGASTAHGALTTPVNNVLAITASGTGRTPPPGNLDFLPAAGNNNATMAPTMIGTAGGSQPHPNIQPYLTVNFIIAMSGVYPTRG